MPSPLIILVVLFSIIGGYIGYLSASIARTKRKLDYTEKFLSEWNAHLVKKDA